MKSILIPTDFSPYSQQALDYVLDLMEETTKPCRIILVNTYLVQHKNPNEVIQVNDEMKRKSRLALEEVKEKALVRIKNPNIFIETVTHIGSLKNVVLQILQTENIDLVAIGKHKGEHVDKIITLLRQEDCPLLVTYHP